MPTVSANKTRLLFADDTDLLARARPGIMDRPEFDVVMAASTDEALQLAADAPLGAVVLPAFGEIDGLQVCRTLKGAAHGRTLVILALSADESSRRDACFAAGADDVIFAPIDAADIATRLDRKATGFRTAPHAEVELVVRLASPTGNAVVDAAGQRISREAIQVTLPAGMPPPNAGLLLRVVFTLYEGGTLQVWARTAPPGSGGTVLRFVGLTEPERRAIDYFVDFYLKRSGATNGSAAAQDPPATAGGASVEDLLLSAGIPEAPKQSAVAATEIDRNAVVRALSEAPLEEIAAGVTSLVNGRVPALPAGFDLARVRAALPKLTQTEVSALRGTSMYNSILGDLRDCAASRVRLVEMAAVLREGGARLDKRSAEQAALGAITEAQQIHNALDAGFQELLKGGNTAAVRDLGPVKAGLLSACVELKTALDRDVLGKEVALAPNSKVPPRTPKQTKYSVDVPAKGEPRSERPTKEPKESKEPKALDVGDSAGRRRRVMAVVLVALFAGGIWSNRDIFGVPPKPPAFRPEIVLFESNGIRVWMSSVDGTGTTITWIVDATYEEAVPEARTKLFDDLVSRSPGMKNVRLIDYKGAELATRSP